MIQLRQSLQKTVDSILKNPEVQLNESLNQTFFKHLFTPNFYDLLSQLLKDKQIWYIRHAQSPINQYYQNADNFGTPYPRQQKLFDPTITQKGQYQVTKLPIMYFDVVYISPMMRTLKTFSNINVKTRKQPIVTPLIREKTRNLAGVVGRPKQWIQSNFPSFSCQWGQSPKYWWRHDYKNEPYNEITHQSSSSYKARIALFLLKVLLQGSLRILVISHLAFHEVLHKTQYYQKAGNAKLILIQNIDIFNLFKRIQRRVTPKL